MGLQTHWAPWVLSVASPRGTLCSVQWLAESIHLFICQKLADTLRRQLYQPPVSKNLLVSTIVPGIANCIWGRSLGGPLSVWPFLQSLLYTLSLFLYRETKVSTLWFSFFWASCGLWIISLVFQDSELISNFQWVHIMCVLLWLCYLTQHDIF